MTSIDTMTQTTEDGSSGLPCISENSLNIGFGRLRKRTSTVNTSTHMHCAIGADVSHGLSLLHDDHLSDIVPPTKRTGLGFRGGCGDPSRFIQYADRKNYRASQHLSIRPPRCSRAWYFLDNVCACVFCIAVVLYRSVFTLPSVFLPLFGFFRDFFL